MAHKGWVEQHNDRNRSEAVFVGDRIGLAKGSEVSSPP